MNPQGPADTSGFQRLHALLDRAPALGERLRAVRAFSRRVKGSSHHLTNACNLRCKGCWFFANDFDKKSREQRDLASWEDFARREAARGVTSTLLIGGEPTLVPERIAAFRRHLPFITISTNGIEPLPRQGFEDIAIGVTLFGAGTVDDELRGIKPDGRRIHGLFDRALANYREDPRVVFVMALTESSVADLESWVRRIAENGNRVTFNFYSSYGQAESQHARAEAHAELLREALRVRAAYPHVVSQHPYVIETILTGQSHFGRFGYDVCPCVSQEHPAHAARLANGHPTVPGFNAYRADQSVSFCCTSGECGSCRDSVVMTTWVYANLLEFTHSLEALQTWVDLAEQYWSNVIWSPYFRPARPAAPPHSPAAH